MERNYANDLLKVRYIGEYYKARLTKNKLYLAEHDKIFDVYRLVDDLDDEGAFEVDQFEIEKTLESGGMPQEEEDNGYYD